MKKNRIPALLLALCMLLTMAACGNSAESTAPGSEAASEQAAAESAATAEAPAAAEAAAVSENASAAESAAEPEEPAIDYDEVFAIVHTNDVHGSIDIEPYVKAVADDLRAQYGEKNVATVCAGDVFSGGNAVAHLYNGETIPPIMDAAGYDILVPGNNDYTTGEEQLKKLASMSTEHMTMICSNLYEQVLDEDGMPITDENGERPLGDPAFPMTLERTTEGGVKVGFFGLCIYGGSVDDVFTSRGSVESAADAVATLQAEDCGIIVGVGHTGWNDDLVTPTSNDTTSAQLVKEVPGIDAYVDGHSHSIINEGNGWFCPETGTLVNQASCKGKCLGIMRLYIKDGKVIEKEASILTEEELEAQYTPDPEVQKLVDAAWERLAGDAGEMYYESDTFLSALRSSESEDGRSIRTDETNLGDVVTDAMRDKLGCDVVMAAGYHIRASLNEGKIYAINLYDVFANGCDLFRFEITGQELMEKWVNALGALPNEATSFVQMSGASYGYVMGEPAEDGTKTITFVNPMVGGEPLDPEKTYVVYIDAGGPDAPEGQDPEITGMETNAEILGEYLRSGNAVILPDVPTPDNRIVPMDEVPEGAVTYDFTAAAMGGGGGGGGGAGGGNPPPKP